MKKNKSWIYPIISLVGATGTGLQNYGAMVLFFHSIIKVVTRTALGIVQGVAILVGGVCSGLMNFCVNVELLEDFHERLTSKPKPQLEGWQKFRYWAGSTVFVGTGILFGLTAFAFGPAGPLVILSFIAGIFVSAIMIVQELETWLASFDDSQVQKKSLKQIFIEWKNSLTVGKAIGTLISVGNVVALSLLFTVGLATFFIGLGVPAFPAVITGFVVAFTGGAFTEFYFYNRFLSSFCDKVHEKWEGLKKTKYPVIGVVCGIANAVGNGVLAYAGIIMITSLLAAASIAVPPVGIVVAVAVISAVFAGAASFILGMDFWVRNSAKLTGYFSKKEKAIELAPELDEEKNNSTRNILEPLLEKKPVASEMELFGSNESALPEDTHSFSSTITTGLTQFSHSNDNSYQVENEIPSATASYIG